MDIDSFPFPSKLIEAEDDTVIALMADQRRAVR
jgi:hypothetical protein